MNLLLDRNALTFRIAALFVSLCLPYYLIFDYLHLYSARSFVFPTAMPSLLALVFQRLGWELLSKLTLIWGTAGCLFIAADILGPNAGMRMLVLSLLPLPFLLLEFSEKKWLLSSVLVFLLVYFGMGRGYALPLISPEMITSELAHIIHAFVDVTTFLLLILSAAAYFFSRHQADTQIWLKTQELRDSHAALAHNNMQLQTAYTRLESQQALLKRRITAIHAMTESCKTRSEWETVCTQIFQHHLVMTPRVWLADEGAKLSVNTEAMNKGGFGETVPQTSFFLGGAEEEREELKGLRWSLSVAEVFNPMSAYGQALLSQIGCFTWNENGVSVLLPLVSGSTLIGMIGLSPPEPLSTEDLEFAVMVAKELQKTLQLIRSTEAMKTLNMVEFVQKNEAMFRSLNITDRELTIIDLLVQGVSNGEISSQLVVTESTTKRHVYNIFRKLKISNRFELMKWLNARVLEGLG